MSSVIKSNGGRWCAYPHGVFVVESNGRIVSEPAADDYEVEELTPEETARQRVLDAEARAREIVERARQEAKQISQEAYNAGFSHGMEEAEKRWIEQFTRIKEQVQLLEQEREELFKAAEPELAKLSIEIAKKILKQELAQNPESILSVVRSAVHRVKDREVRILVNPKDLEIVRGSRESLMGIVDGISHMDIIEDRRVGQGGCILEMPSGNLDARIETQLAHIEETITRGYEEAV